MVVCKGGHKFHGQGLKLDGGLPLIVAGKLRYCCQLPVVAGKLCASYCCEAHHGRIRLAQAVDTAAELTVSIAPDVRPDSCASVVEGVQHGQTNGSRGRSRKHRQAEVLPEVLDGDSV